MELVSIGDIAAQNIARALDTTDEKAIEAIRQAISDEINAMSSHFAFAFSDMQADAEKQIAWLSSWRGFLTMRWNRLFV